MTYPSVRRWLVEHTSLEPSLLEGAGFDTLVAERVWAVGGGSEADYIVALDRSADEVDRLAGGIAVPETWFFRYAQSFKLLAEVLERWRNTGAASLRMLSIGCATGEEPYGMAMAALHAGWPAGSVVVDAVDRNRDALARAVTGEYGAASIRTELPEWAMGYLRRSGESIAVDPDVRALVRFERVDILRPGGLSMGSLHDVIFCRNVLIYLGEGARKRVLDSIWEGLAPGGLLFVGHAEPLLCSASHFTPLAAPHAFALERTAEEQVPAQPNPVVRRAARRIHAHPGTAGAVSRTPKPAAVESAKEPTLEDARDLADAGRAGESEAVVRAIMARHGPSGAALELLGMIRMAANDRTGARALFEQAVYLEPERPACLIQLAMICEHRGESEKAARLWERARRAGVSRHEGRGL